MRISSRRASIATRLMGLLIAAIAVQLTVEGLLALIRA